MVTPVPQAERRATLTAWPVVFVPSLTEGRFRSRRTGKARPWLVDRSLFDADRYEGSDGDERRLLTWRRPAPATGSCCRATSA